MSAAPASRPSPAAQLKIQLEFIETSCELVDKGRLSEAARIATCIRVILRHTKNSISLLAQLQAQDVPLLTTCEGPLTDDLDALPRGSTRLLHYDGMGSLSVSVAPGTASAMYRPRLGSGPIRAEIPAQDWWRQLIVAMDPETKFTRRSLVLNVADRDGGAHVDPQISAAYDRLAYSKEIMALVVGDSSGRGTRMPIFGYHVIALRQLGYELLNSPQLLALTTRT